MARGGRENGRTGAGGGRLSVEAARFYARIYTSARAGCLGELRRAGCIGEEAEDIFAATFERIMGKIDPIGQDFSPAKMVALLKHASHQKLIDERRHRGVLKMVPLGDDHARLQGTGEGPAEAVEEREAVEMGREAISSLPERDRLLFFQRHHLGLSPEEILRRNPGLTERTYRKIMQRANARALRAFEEIGSGTRCEQIRGERLRRYAIEEVGETEARAIEAHLRHCRSCRAATAQMRGILHELAGGLAILAAAEGSRGALGEEAQALIEATRSLRERLRELAIRFATALGGPGGESAAGQLVGIKAASVCAAGALAVGCLAVGVVPAVTGSEPPARQVHPSAPEPAAAVEPHAPQATSKAPAEPVSASRPHKARRSSRPAGAGAGEAVSRVPTPTQTLPRPSTEVPSRPSVSGAETGAQFGAGADGTGTVISPAPSNSPSAASAPTPEGELSPRQGSEGTGRETGSQPEFGF